MDLSKKIQILTSNVNGFRDKNKREIFYSKFAKTNRIIAMQETHGTCEIENLLKEEWRGESLWSHGTARERGVAFLIPKKFKGNVRQVKKDKQGRVIAILFVAINIEINIINIYAPNKPQERAPFFDKLSEFVINPKAETILVGDFNMTENNELDRVGTMSPLQEMGKIELQNFCTNFGIEDVFRELNGNDKQYTWMSGNRKQKSRLDRIYAAKGTTQATKIIQNPISDHSSFLSKFKLIATRRMGTASYWKMNIALLEDKEYKEKIKLILKNANKINDFNPWVWEETKINIKRYTIKASTQRTKKIREQIQELQLEGENKNKAKIKELKRDLNKGTLVRQGLDPYEISEFPTKEFFNREIRRKKKQIITELKTKSGETIRDPKEINKEIFDYYKHLYKSDGYSEEDTDKLLKKIDKKLTQTQRQIINEPFDAREIKSTIRKLNTGKAPGIDGIPSEFYQEFSEEVAPILTKLYNYFFDYPGKMTISQRTAIVTLLPKNGDRELLKNWRPVSLLCADYKIMTKALAQRVTACLPTIIGTQQTAAIPGREIFNNLNLIRDIIEYAKNKNKTFYLVNFDQEKAFDRLNHKYIEKVLKRFGFPKKFIQLVQTMYKDITSEISDGTDLTPKILIERGVRQGCPLSQVLYVIAIEPLAMAIIKDENIEPLGLPGKEKPKIIQFADDSNLLTEDLGNIQKVKQHFYVFHKASEAKLNEEKTQILRIGRPTRKEGFYPEIKIQNEVKVLGIWFLTNSEKAGEKNFEIVCKKIEKTAKNLNLKSLSLFGKALLLNCKILSKIWYLATVFPIPKWVIKKINELTEGTLWGNPNRHPLKYEVRYLPKEEGGLNLLDPFKHNIALRLRFIFHISKNRAEGKENFWITLPKYFLGARIGKIDTVFKWLTFDNTFPKLQNQQPPKYYEQLLEPLKLYCKQARESVYFKEEEFLTNVQTKTIRKIMRTKVLHLKGIKYWGEQFPTQKIKWKKAWKLGTDTMAFPKVKDVSFMLRHDSLSTNQKINKTYTLSNTSDKCNYCGETETLIHIFLQCQPAKWVWEYVTNITDKLGLKNQKEKLVLGDIENKDKEIRLFIVTLTQIANYVIWNSRNKKKFEKKNPNQQNVREQMQDLIQMTILQLDKKQPKNFLMGTLYRKNKNKIIFHDTLT